MRSVPEELENVHVGEENLAPQDGETFLFGLGTVDFAIVHSGLSIFKLGEARLLTGLRLTLVACCARLMDLIASR